jgi:hypothetical protein
VAKDSVRLYGSIAGGVIQTYTRKADTIEERWASISDRYTKDEVRRVRCAEHVEGCSYPSQNELGERIELIKAGKVEGSYYLLGDVWFPAFGKTWSDNIVSEGLNIPISMPGPRKPIPAIIAEVLVDPQKFKNVDYMAAVRASCKGTK